MKTLKARVRAGRLTLDAPTKFPEGTVFELTLADPEDELSERERAELHSALEAGWSSACAGRLQPASKLVSRLQRKR